MVGNSTTELLLVLVCTRLGQTREAVAGRRTSLPTSSLINRLKLTLKEGYERKRERDREGEKRRRTTYHYFKESAIKNGSTRTSGPIS